MKQFWYTKRLERLSNAPITDIIDAYIANEKLNRNFKEALVEVKENNEYVCGGVSIEDPRQFELFVRRKLTCYIIMEVTFSSAKYVKLNSVCFYRCGVSAAELANDDAIKELLK